VAHPFTELEETEVPTQPSPVAPPITPFLLETPFQVPIFHHGPPPSVHGCRHWPPNPDFQSSPVFASLTIADIYVHISLFLDELSCRSIHCTLVSLWYGVIGTPLWYYPPWYPYRRCLWGFGTPTLGRSTHHAEPGQIAVLPYAWAFLDPPVQATCSHVCPSWRSYILL
jgi:hypothetical protein